MPETTKEGILRLRSVLQRKCCCIFKDQDFEFSGPCIAHVELFSYGKFTTNSDKNIQFGIFAL